MAYLNLDLDYFDHPKTVRLVGLLGRGADILPIRLWAYAGKYHAETGDLIGYSPKAIEAAVKWWGQPGLAVEAMVSPFMGKPGFLEQIEQGFKVHDWENVNGHIFALKKKAQAGAKARWAKYNDAQAMPKHSLSITPGNAPNKEGKAGSLRDGEGPGEEGLADAFCRAFRLKPVTPEEEDGIYRAAGVLLAKGAKPSDIAPALDAYRKAWPKAVATVPALVRWWDTFAPEPPKERATGSHLAEVTAARTADAARWEALTPEEQSAELEAAAKVLGWSR